MPFVCGNNVLFFPGDAAKEIVAKVKDGELAALTEATQNLDDNGDEFRTSKISKTPKKFCGGASTQGELGTLHGGRWVSLSQMRAHRG